jgi:Protein of unknown function (DUF3239)
MDRKIGDPGEFLNASMASRAVNIKPDMRKVRRLDIYHRSYRKYLFIGLGIAAGLLVIAGVLLVSDHLKSGMLFLILAVALGLFSLRFRQMLTGDAYTNGLLVAGVVTSVSPLRLAVAAEVENGSGENPQNIVWGVKQIAISDLTLHPAQLGEQVPCVALFGGDNNGVHADFEPRPLAWGTDNPAVVQAAHAAIEPEEWAIAAHLAAQAAHLTSNSDIAYFDEDLQLIAPPATASADDGKDQ